MPSFSLKKSLLTAAVVLAAASLNAAPEAAAAESAGPRRPKPPALGCPTGTGWAEGLGAYLQPGGQFPVNDTQNDTPQTPAHDCVFHQWSWEAFTWATALDANNVPRFMRLKTIDDLLAPATTTPVNPPPGPVVLSLGKRHHNKQTGKVEGAGAIVEADGNVMVAPNGYPIYASVHMNDSYFATAKANLLINGGYMTRPQDAYFELGAAVFKATWMRVDSTSEIPAGAFTTQASVPVLQVVNGQVVPTPGQNTTVTVALVGLHVVGYTANHPEFLWATFEHRDNCPRTADNTFSINATPAAKNYTFYTANTPYTQVDELAPKPTYFNPATQKFAPITNVVLKNATGGENFSPRGPANIAAVNSAAQGFIKTCPTAVPPITGVNKNQPIFANYDLIGTVWMTANTYQNLSALSAAQVAAIGSASGVGSVNLANSTAETFQQVSTNANPANVQNCFLCHNPTTLSGQSYQQNPNGTYTFGSTASLPGGTPFSPRRISISHVLEAGTSQAVQNQVPVATPNN